MLKIRNREKLAWSGQGPLDLEHWGFGHWSLFRISIFEIRIYLLKSCLVGLPVPCREGQGSPVTVYDFMVRSFANSQM